MPLILAPDSWLLTPGSAEILDRIVAVVENRIITVSDIRQERNVQAALGENGSKDDKIILQELIEAYLIEDQITQFPGIEVSPSEMDAELSNIQDLRGASREAIRQGIRRRLRTARYFDLRFQQFIRATDEEIRKYYEDVFVPEAQKRGLSPIPVLESVRDLIQNNVIQEKLNHDVDNWLETIRRRSRIEIFN